MNLRASFLSLILILCNLSRGFGAAGDLDTPFNPGVNNGPVAVAVQPDGRMLLGGQFTQIGGVARTWIGKINGDGTRETAFTTTVDDQVFCSAVQADGKLLIGGEFTHVNGVSRFKLARLNADGTLDAGFNPTASLAVYSLAVQPDGKIIVAGNFNTLTGVNQFKIARLNANGTLDAAFNPVVLAQVWCAVLQTDGKILIGGSFDTVNTVARSFVARLNADGTLDTTFNPSANNVVYTIAVQADGQIVLGGNFTTMGGVARNRVARVNATGALDTTFNPNANGIVWTTAAQTDGKVVIGGFFTTVGGAAQRSVARLTTTGARDTTFVATTNDTLESAVVQADGKVLIGGNFTTVNGVSRAAFVRLLNDPVTQALTVPTATRVQWLRGGASPETQVVTFELSTDGGTAWTALGPGVRIAGGWERTGLALPASGRVRARAWVPGAKFSGSNSLVETAVNFVTLTNTPPSLTFPLSPVIVEAASATGSIVSFTVAANDTEDGILTPSVSKTSGSIFSIGDTTVNVSATDSGSLTTTGSFIVRVRDTTAPVVAVHSNVNATPTSVSGAIVNYAAASATDAVGVTSLTYSQNSGTLFPTGTTTVTITAQDAANNAATGTFTVTVNGLTVLQSWRQRFFNDVGNSGNAADNADPDGDGITNIMEFAFGTDPTIATSGPGGLQYTGTFAGGGTIAAKGQPIARFEAIPFGVDYRALFVRRDDYIAAGLTYTVQFSADMSTWFTVATAPSVLADDGTMQIVSVPYPFFVGGKKAHFFRVQVTGGQ